MVDQTKRYLIVGAGVTGCSVLRYLTKSGCDVAVADAAQALTDAHIAREPLLACTQFYAGGWSRQLLCQFDCLVVSPGISIRTAEFKAARQAGVEIIGDVELFARVNQRPVIAVTGSNGKSTVVSLVGAILDSASISADLIGNLGTPCLDVLESTAAAVVIELSSFQLETTQSLSPLAATVLNVSPDHLDRYRDLEDYASAKRRIYNGAKYCLMNHCDALTQLREGETQVGDNAQLVSFSTDAAVVADWQLGGIGTEVQLLGPDSRQVDLSRFKLEGVHNAGNALAAAALTGALVDDDSLVASGLAQFAGLPHRMQLVRQTGSVRWYNDSKGTNAGATISALQGTPGPIILIAGGRGKNADYTELSCAVQEHCRVLILIGEEAPRIATAVGDAVAIYHETDMQCAVRRAAEIATAGDSVLLSPACASFDMFSNFECRGLAFENEVRKLCA